ncbi:hypothetical protein ESZ50_04740 [Weissella muntiaci]|uniref:Uncharacterized protein n=1 Tax=Weissella muntiaci TaxID=2508881 RepID=A0A6C2C8E8_9LACO|nr:hypothetical protein [Weissella muntiaci]TYC49902.1 hypothetical protein ESZ50_04740 [Weissella muntiaci]
MIVSNKGDFVRFIGDIRLVPGTNDVSEAELKKLKAVDSSNPVFAAVMEDLVLPEGETKLSSYKVDDAKKLIDETFDVALLGNFRDEEAADANRKTVLDYIDKKVDEIMNGDEKEA